MADHRKSGSIRYPPVFGSSKLSVELSPYPVVVAGWHRTHQLMTKLNLALEDEVRALNVPQPFTVAVAGSFGRMEANSFSDLDFMVLSPGALPEQNAQDIAGVIRRCAQALDIKLPNPGGVFAQNPAYSYHDLIELAGDKDDSLVTLAQRMLILMEARPIYNEEVFRNALDRILRKYLQEVGDLSHKVPMFLLNDLIRYFRGICVNYQFNFWQQEEKWALRNIKLRYSRIVMYAGLLLTVLNAGTKPSKHSYLFEMCQLAPLERIVSVYQDAGSSEYTRVLALYDVFLLRLQDTGIRERLQIDYGDRFNSDDYRELKATSGALSAELTRFVLSQRGRWSERVFEALLF